MYATIADMRAEGVTEAMATDARLGGLLQEASRNIDRITGWFFSPREKTFLLDGRGTHTLELPAYPIHIDQCVINGSAVSIDESRFLIVGAPVQPGCDGPRITLRYGRFPKGRGNVQVDGLFGYTEDDGTPFGCTPLEIRRATMLLVLRMLPPLGDTDASRDARNAWRVIEERTRDQSYKLDKASGMAPFTGDPEVDAILARYMKPAGLGVA